MCFIGTHLGHLLPHLGDSKSFDEKAVHEQPTA